MHQSAPQPLVGSAPAPAQATAAPTLTIYQTPKLTTPVTQAMIDQRREAIKEANQ